MPIGNIELCRMNITEILMGFDKIHHSEQSMFFPLGV